MDRRWAREKRHELLMLIIYSAVGLAVVTALVTLANYAMYSGVAGK
jgi:hypothetical protein